MHCTFTAGWLVRLKGAVGKPFASVFDQIRTFVAKLTFCGVVLVVTVEYDHHIDSVKFSL